MTMNPNNRFKSDTKVSDDAIEVNVIFGQMWDAAQNLVGVSLYGYTPKMFVT